MKKYDAIVIGSGQGGTPLAKKLAESGLKTALIEQRWVGGTCVNDGCSPTKAMIASAKYAWLANHGKTLGVTADNVHIDFAAIIKRKNAIVNSMRKNVEKGISETANLDLVVGSATFSGVKELTVKLNKGDSEQYAADQIFINTGLAPDVPDMEGITDIDYLTSTTIMELKELPKHLLIIGSGYIGLEFGQMFRRFGSEITILEPSERILTHEDADIAEEITKILSEENIKIMTNSHAVAVVKKGSDLTVHIEKSSRKSTIHCSHILIAAGRKPQTGELNLPASGIQTDEKGYIKVNDKLETSQPGIYALGDVKGGPAFTHISYDDYRIISENVLEKGKASTAGRLVPYCMFIDPQLGRIGITEQEAKKQGLDVRVAVLKNYAVARAVETGDERGMMKAVVDAKTGKILGAAVLAEQGGEIVTILQMAMMGNVTYDKIRNGVFAHPTYAESLNNLFMKLDT
ncbi:mercuric reductase [Dyadobacter bucti]|uniref:mercuric reductase n=1 Tax=Dyadobacter bucti TaxID=2572203 RepID=UPI003F70509E